MIEDRVIAAIGAAGTEAASLRGQFQGVREATAAELPVLNCEYCGSHYRAAPGVVLCSECVEWERILGPRKVYQKPWREEQP